MSTLPQPTPASENKEEEKPPTQYARWHKRVLAFCLITFALEIGLFLAIFPWTRNWAVNFVPLEVPDLAGVWMNFAFRGAISGLGLLDVWIAGAELWRLVRRIGHARET